MIHVFPTRAALLASQMMTTVARGDTYTQVEWVLLESHSQLLNLLLASQRHNSGLIFQRCQRLTALIKRSSIPPSKQLLTLQLQVHDWTCTRTIMTV